MIRAGVGYSITLNPRTAALEATRAALQQAGLRTADGALCFASSRHGGAFPQLVRTVSEVAGTDEIIGCGAVSATTGIAARPLRNGLPAVMFSAAVGSLPSVRPV